MTIRPLKLLATTLAWIMAVSCALSADFKPTYGLNWDDEIDRALSHKEPGSQELALMKVLAAGLLDESKEVRTLVRMELTRRIRVLDLRPYEDILRRAHGTYQDDPSSLLDMAEMFHGQDREWKVQLLRSALSKGSAELPNGTRLTQFSALRITAQLGIIELRDLAFSAQQELDDKTRNRVSMAFLSACFDLYGTESESTSPIKTAISRLESMEPNELIQKATSDSEYSAVVRDFLWLACKSGLHRERDRLSELIHAAESSQQILKSASGLRETWHRATNVCSCRRLRETA